MCTIVYVLHRTALYHAVPHEGTAVQAQPFCTGFLIKLDPCGGRKTAVRRDVGFQARVEEPDNYINDSDNNIDPLGDPLT